MSARAALVVVVIVIVLAVAGLFIWPVVRSRQAAVPSAPSAAQDHTTPGLSGGWYEIFFTTPQYPDKPANHHGGLDEKLVAFMDTAQKSLDVADYDFDLADVAQAMARAKVRGVQVRMVTDSDTYENKDKDIQAAFQILKQAGIPIVPDNRKPIMHNKFAVVDNNAVWTGSWNFTTGDTYRLNNNAVLFRVPQLAMDYSAEFEKMFTNHKFGPTKPKEIPYPTVTVDGTRIEVYFASENDPRPRLVDQIRSAKRSIDFLAFSFTDDSMGDAMIAQAKQGVKVRGVFETTGSETRYSEFGKMKQAGLEVYQDGNPYVMHHKVIVFDGQVVAFGSFNFSNNAAEDNDENLLIVYNPAFAQAFLGEVDRVIAQAKAPPAKGAASASRSLE